MSNPNPNFVSELVMMAKAFEELPQVKQQVSSLMAENDHLLSDVQAREASILKLKAELEAAHAEARQIAEARDEAIRNFHAGEDRTRSALAFIKATFGSAGSLIQALEPPATPSGLVPMAGEVVSETSGGPALEPSDQQVADAMADAPSQGQSEPLPQATDGSHTVHETASTAPTVEASTMSSPEPGPSGFTLHGDPTNVDSVSVGERATDPTGATTQASESAQPTTPEADTSATSAVNTSTEPAPDDVGYHNEPVPHSGHDGWHDWDQWALRMNNRYGTGTWPQRS